MDAISTTRLAAVIPELRRRILLLDGLLSVDGIHLRVVQGYRTFTGQATLYAQGRNPDGSYIDPVHHTGVVTNAHPLDSMHVYGLAVDCAPDLPGLPTWQPDWNERDPRWQEFLAKAQTCGLAEGAQWRSFPDSPHLYPQELPADPDDTLKAILSEGGVQAVWDYVNEQFNFAKET